MKQADFLNALLPEISSIISQMDLSIGDREFEHNDFCYDQDGWLIEFGFDLKGTWSVDYGFENIRGRVTDLSVYHYDEETDEENEFSEIDLLSFRNELESVLNNLD